jgi:hypothetical protein
MVRSRPFFLRSLFGSVKRGHPQNVRAYQRFEKRKTAMEEVIGARHDHNRQVLRPRPGENISQRDGFIVLAVDHEGVMADLGHRPLAGGAADEHEVARRMVTRGKRAGRARRDETAEREPGERERQSRRHAARERRQGRDGVDQVDEVLGFTTAFIVCALAAADTAEVRAHRKPSERGAT